jgi:hypothetical protein
LTFRQLLSYNSSRRSGTAPLSSGTFYHFASLNSCALGVKFPVIHVPWMA